MRPYAQPDLEAFGHAPAVAAHERDSGPLPGGRTTAERIALADVVARNHVLPGSGRILFVSAGPAGPDVAPLGTLDAV
jgi:hypothetical protein